MPKRPSVEKAGRNLIEVMKETAEDGDLETFKKVLRAWEIQEGSTNEEQCLTAWHEKRDEILRSRAAARKGSSR